MKTTLLQVLLLLGTATSLWSCRKETPAANIDVNLLTDESWLYDEFGIDNNLDGQIDIPEDIDNCAKDDLVKFNTDGSGSFDQGVDHCYPDFPQSYPFDWQLENNETQLEYGGEVHTILALNEAQLAIYTEEMNGTGMVRHILVYKH